MIAIVDSKLMAYLEMHQGKPVVNLFDSLIPIFERIDSINPFNKISRIVFVFDIGKSSYRLGLWEKYKGNRTYATVPPTFKDIYESSVPEIARSLGIATFTAKDVEADDLAGILCGKIKEPICLISGDHDWYGLVLRHEHVNMFDPKKFSYHTTSDMYELTGCKNEEQFSIKKSILGDSGDNIIGIPAIGPVKFGRWTEDIFNHPNGLDEAFLKEEFLKLCHKANEKNKTHREYTYAGVSSCEELYDFNRKLGKIMTGVSLLNPTQKKQLIADYAYYTSPLSISIQTALDLITCNCDGAVGPFGDTYQIPMESLNYYQGVIDGEEKLKD